MNASRLDVDTLWIIFEFIGDNWGNAHLSKMSKTQFSRVLIWQVELNSAYDNYYREAVSRFQELLLENGGDKHQALKVLYSENQLPNAASNIGQFVLLEFMRWQLAFGGFRLYGYENYVGWMEGGSYLNSPPPYRALP